MGGMSAGRKQVILRRVAHQVFLTLELKVVVCTDISCLGPLSLAPKKTVFPGADH